MFNLSHDRLAEGGRAIIKAKDDVGQMLFSIGTGLSDLRERLSQLEEEADGLWGPYRSGKRSYHQAEARFNNATRQQREHFPVCKCLAKGAKSAGRRREGL